MVKDGCLWIVPQGEQAAYQQLGKESALGRIDQQIFSQWKSIERRTNSPSPLRLLKITRIINSILVFDVNSYLNFTSATDH